VAPFVGSEMQSIRQGNLRKYINKTVHWFGTVIGVDASKNNVLFKMNPSYSSNPAQPDLVL